MLLCFGSFTMVPGVPELMCDVDHRASPAYVSRGGIKLENALAASGLHVYGRRALDVGASTGGFTDCLLRHGATGVVAVDVGYGQLAWSLRIDSRVSVMERTNARALTLELLPSPPPGHGALLDLATIDVSFISLTKVLPAVLGCMAGTYDVMALIKPQFEVGRVLASKGRGVVRDPGDRRDALVQVGRAALGLGAAVLGYYSSGLAGPKGNKETFVWLAEPGRAGRSSIGGAADTAELEAMARMVEP